MLDVDIKFIRYRISKLESDLVNKKHTELGAKKIINNINIYKDILGRLESERDK